MKRKLLILAVGVLAGLTAAAQSRGGLRINEVMVTNDNSVVDDYGNHEAWIELYNSTYAPLEISSVYLTTDRRTPLELMELYKEDPDMLASLLYRVPLGDVNTKIEKRQHVIFWADGAPSKGTFHTSLTLDTTKDNWIGIYDANGLTLIDYVEVPAGLVADTSYARKADGVRSAENPADDWEIRDGSAVLDNNGKVERTLDVTPGGNNNIVDTNDKVELFSKTDEHGFALTIMAMCIVFSALLILCLSFLAINRIGMFINRRNKMRAHGINPSEVKRSERPDSDSGEVIAAIAMALRDHLEAHDSEKTVLTINKVKKAYSPWSSKIYSMRQTPTK